MAFKDEDIFGAKSGPEFKDDDIFGGDKAAAPAMDETGQPIIEVTNADGPSVAEKLNNPYFGIDSVDKLKAEMAKNAQPVIDDMGAGQRFVTGLGAGLYDAYKGIEQAGAGVGEKLGLVQPETVQKITQEGQEARDVFAPLKKQSKAASIGEFGGKIAPFLALPAAAPEGALARFAVGSGTGGGMGALEFVPEGGSRLENAATGAVFGGAGSAVLSGAGKLYNIVATNPLARFGVNDLSKRFKIPTTLSELTGKSDRTDAIMERVPSPFGIKGFREKQQEAAKNAATEHFGNYTIDPTLSSTEAMKVANDAHLDQVFQNVRTTAASLPDAPAPEVKQVAEDILNRYPSVFESIQDNHVKRILKNVVGDTEDKTMQVPGVPAPAPNISNTPPVPPQTVTVTPTFSFDDLWTLRKGIGKELGDAKTNTARSQLSALYAAVSNDMDNLLATQSPDAVMAFKEANEAYKQYALKFDVLRQAYDKAMGTTGAGTMGFFSPQKYGTALKNLANDPTYKKNIKWSPTEIEEMTGLANILQVTKRAGQFMENPPTGNRWGMPSIAAAAGGGSYYAGGMAATLKTAGVAATAALVTKFLTTTNAGKRIALSASKIEPTSPAMQKVMGQIYKQLPKFAAEAGISMVNSPDGKSPIPAIDAQSLPDPLGIRTAP